MANDRSIVNKDGIIQIAQNIDSRRQDIMDVYKSKILPILQSSSECLSVSGLDYEDVIKSFDNVFNSLDTQITDLYRALTDKIIPSYENSSNIIRQLFNSEFAEELSKILSIMNQ